MLDITAAAWAVLVPQWAARWAIILGVGMLPWLASRAYAFKARPLPGKFPIFRQTCAFVACAVSVWSFQLAADTYLVEAQKLGDLETKACTVQERVGSHVNLVCHDGTTYQDVPAQESGPENPKLFLLPNSGLPVYFGA